MIIAHVLLRDHPCLWCFLATIGLDDVFSVEIEQASVFAILEEFKLQVLEADAIIAQIEQRPGVDQGNDQTGFGVAIEVFGNLLGQVVRWEILLLFRWLIELLLNVFCYVERIGHVLIVVFGERCHGFEKLPEFDRAQQSLRELADKFPQDLSSEPHFLVNRELRG